jgi:hypothetical protein
VVGEDTKAVAVPSSKVVPWEHGSQAPQPRRCSRLLMVDSPNKELITLSNTTSNTTTTTSTINSIIFPKQLRPNTEDPLTVALLITPSMPHIIILTRNNPRIEEDKQVRVDGSQQDILHKEEFIILLQVLECQVQLQLHLSCSLLFQE